MWSQLASDFRVLDFAALALLGVAWFVTGWMAEHPPKKYPSVTVLMAAYRKDWMVEMLTRQPRIFDAAILSTLRQGTTFLTSASMLAVGGVLALAGNAERLDNLVMGVAQVTHPALFWQAKLALVAFFLTHAVFKFIWSNRLFGYCAIVMAATPNEPNDERALPRARKAAELNTRAALNFNRGLRSVYYAFATLAWVIGPAALILATLITSWTLLSREFASRSRGVLLET
jgi:uncharacterized membrane protein